MLTVFRHEIPHWSKSSGNQNSFHLNMHGGAQIVNVAETAKKIYKRGESNKWEWNFKMFLWAIEDTDIPAEKRSFRFIQDGERIDWIGDDAGWRHVQTLTSINGVLWMHLFETTGLVVPYIQTGPRRPFSGVAESSVAIEEIKGED